MPVLSLEGLLGLNMQAFSDGPRRIRDDVDMIELIKTRRENMKFDDVRSYLRLFDKERVLDDILKALG